MTRLHVVASTMAHHEPSRNDPCVCGSGKKFKRCCAGVYSAEMAPFHAEFNAGNYDKALLHARHHFTWYALAHRAHTVPLLRGDPGAGEELLRIDIEALAELLENVQLCYYRLDRQNEFPAVLDAVAKVAVDERWDAKIAYLRGLGCVVFQDDESAALRAIQTIDLQRCSDPDVLALFLQICPEPLPFTQALAIIDRILANTSRESVRLQYRVLKALKHYMIGEPEEGAKIFESALTTFRELPAEKKSSHGKMLFAYALETYGTASDQHDVLVQGKTEVTTLIRDANDEFTANYFADLYKLLGDVEEGLGNHDAAIKAYSNSLDRDPSDLTKAFLARAVCNNGDVSRSRQVLDEIDDSSLSAPGRFDLALSWALLAATSLKASEIDVAKSRLREISVSDPLFVQLRDRWMIELLETKSSSTRPSGPIRRLILGINKYVTLNPNVFGFGVNLNRVIDDWERSNEDE